MAHIHATDVCLDSKYGEVFGVYVRARFSVLPVCVMIEEKFAVDLSIFGKWKHNKQTEFHVDRFAPGAHMVCFV